MTTTPSPATASTPPLIQRLAAGDCLWVIVTDTEVQSLLRAGHAYIAATLPHRSEMVTLAITEEGRYVAAFQRQNLWQAGAFGGGMQQAVRLAMLAYAATDEADASDV